MRSFLPQPPVRNRCAHRQSYHALVCMRAGDRMTAALDRLGALVRASKFNPDQPRVPAGNPEGGQWTGGGDGFVGTLPVDAIATSGGPALRALCEAQFERDIFQCTMVGLRSCYAQAYERYSACLARRPIPPFNY